MKTLTIIWTLCDCNLEDVALLCLVTNDKYERTSTKYKDLMRRSVTGKHSRLPDPIYFLTHPQNHMLCAIAAESIPELMMKIEVCRSK